MKASIAVWGDKPYGVELVAENGADCDVLRQFWLDGVKVNGFTRYGATLEITFAGLIDKMMQAEEGP